jgi:hypothetical protein
MLLPASKSAPLLRGVFRCYVGGSKAADLLRELMNYMMERRLASEAAKQDCQNPKCAAYTLTTNEFMLLRGENWTQGFKVRLGQLAGKLYEQLYGKKRSRKIRTHLMAHTSRNRVRTYPCGILEQVYRAMVSRGAAPYPVASIDRDGTMTAASTMEVGPSPQNAP